MRDTAPSLRISVLGPLRVEAGEGLCLTPKGAKNQALLALLALSPEMSRPRRWLEDKLFSRFTIGTNIAWRPKVAIGFDFKARSRSARRRV